MSSFFEKLGGLFGIGSGGKEKPKEYTGEKPYKSLTETPQGALYWKTLQDRLAGLGVGPEEFLIDVGKTTAPFATARKADLENYEIPTISAQASARGVGRSTIPVNRIALSTQEASRDIEQRIADLQIRNAAIQQTNEMQKRAEITDALSKLGIFTGAEAGQQGVRTAFDYGDYGRVEGEKEKQYNASMEGLKNLVSFISPTMADILKPKSKTGAGVAGGRAESLPSDILKALVAIA